MIYRLAADFVVAIHFAYVMFVILGLIATVLGWILSWQWVRNRWFRGAHLTMIAIVVFEAWMGITCPLTTWEQELRMAAGEKTYQGGFIARWLHDAMFFEAPPWVFTCCYTTFGMLVLVTWLVIPPRWKTPASLGR